MKKMLYGVLAAALIATLGGSVFMYSGVFDIAADSPHSALVHAIIKTTRDRAIDSRAASVSLPTDLADAERVRRGSGNYDEMCVGCHSKPGKTDSEIRKGLLPTPPDLTKTDPARNANSELNAKRQFWVIKHGIKASGMAAWGKGGMDDAAIWDIVAFVQKLPSLSADEYRNLVAASEGHSHAGVDHRDTMDARHDEGKSAPKEKSHADHGKDDHPH